MAKSRRFKTAILQIHLWLGLATGLVVFIISVTGSIYVFEEEIRDFTQQEKLYVPAEQKPFVGLAAIIKSYQKVSKNAKLTTIRINNSRPDATVMVAGGKKNEYYFNPYTAALVKKAQPDWLDIDEDLHRTLLLGEPGKFIMNWSVVIFVIMLISGWILWFPNQMRLLRQSLTIKWNASVKRVTYDLHNVLGFYASGILIVIALSGLYFAFDGFKAGATFLTGSKLTKPVSVGPVKATSSELDNLPQKYESIYSAAIAEYPGAKETALSIRKTGELRLRIIYPSEWFRKQNVFYFDPATLQMSKYKLYKNFKLADKLESTNYDLHTGQLFGIFGKIVAFIAALISASLPITGLMIWLRKQKKTKKTGVVPIRKEKPVYSA
ncbi:MAG: PepSY-associated TM helix domain-containing protein [Pedobacter sp.]|uniref:PepSY-associated TM helix domain-containing protein n=1 Tax=Pedobacter sp. TaxID=1411316 RepID=UPI003394E295